MLTLPLCHILTQDEIFPEIEANGLVVVFGESPNATVRISVPDFASKKYVTLDRLTRASFSRKGETWTVKGVSDHLRDVVGAENAVISMMVTPEPGCEDCQK